MRKIASLKETRFCLTRRREMTGALPGLTRPSPANSCFLLPEIHPPPPKTFFASKNPPPVPQMKGSPKQRAARNWMIGFQGGWVPPQSPCARLWSQVPGGSHPDGGCHPANGPCPRSTGRSDCSASTRPANGTLEQGADEARGPQRRWMAV